jgi:hypothetical protein
VLDSRGQIGQAALGTAGDNVYVNAATGNLVVTNTDEVPMAKAIAITEFETVSRWSGSAAQAGAADRRCRVRPAICSRQADFGPQHCEPRKQDGRDHE